MILSYLLEKRTSVLCRLGVGGLFLMMLTACGGSGGGSSASPVPPTETVDRGALKNLTLRNEYPPAEIDGNNNSYALSGPAQCEVRVYQLIYQSIGVEGEPVDLSAALLVPDDEGCPGPYPLLGQGHGTITEKARQQADMGPNSGYIAFFAAHGYVVVAPDYLGLGVSDYDYHPYLHADSEASAMIDAMRAARHAGEELGIDYSGKVMVAGYSQGGHTAMATQRAIERDHAAEFDLVASAPMAGPYALSQTFIHGWFGESDGRVNPLASELLGYTLVSYEQVYGDLYEQPVDIFKKPYADRVEGAFPGERSLWQLLQEGVLPTVDQLETLRQDDFTADFVANPDNPFRRALERNDLLDWTPTTPMLLCGSSGDAIVEFQNARTAEKVFAARGVDVRVVDVASQVPANASGLEHHAGYGAPLCYRAALDDLFNAAR